MGTPRAEAAALNTLGVLYFNTANYPAALDHYRRAFVLYEQTGNHNGMSNATLNMGVVYQSLGDYSSALEQFCRAQALSEELGDRNGTANATLNIGMLYQSMGEYPSALEYLHRVLSMFEELGNPNRLATATLNIGIVYFRTGSYPQAIEHIQRALSVSEELNNLAGMATCYSNIGAVYGEMGEFPASLQHFQRALVIHQEQGNRSKVASDMSDMGTLYSRSGDHATALECFRQAIAIQEELGNRVALTNSLGSMITVLLDTDQDDEATTLLDQQSTMQMGSPLVQAEYAANRATLSEHRGDLDAAREFLTQALTTVAGSGSRAESSLFHLRLRDLAQKRNDFAGFIEHNAEYQRITEEVRGKDATQKMAVMDAERKAEHVDRERVKERALLYGALPKSVADRMLRGEKVSGDHYDDASVIFADIVGFTQLSEQMSPGDVVNLLEELFTLFDAICERHGVTKIKTIGDSYMCVSFDNVVNAALCALEFNRIQYTIQNTESNQAMLQYRIGVHCGPVTAGVIGTQRLQYDVWGDTVNVASRMESAGEPGKVHVSEAFAVNLKSNTEYTIQNAIKESRNQGSHEVPLVTGNSSLVTQLRGSIDIKGKGPMTTYWLSAIQST